MKQLKGFTLVELLIVIALIAILSVAVLATINPIEQANKARDAAMQNDAAEVLNAYERMYANSQEYPWMKFAGGLAVGDTVLVTSQQPGFGICYAALATSYSGAAICNTSSTTNEYGQLILSDELKPSFSGKAPFQSTKTSDRMVTIKEGGAGGSIYVCYVPSAKSNQIMTTKLKCVDSVTGRILNNTGVVGGCNSPTAGATAFTTAATNATDAIWRCVPESSVAVPTGAPTAAPTAGP